MNDRASLAVTDPPESTPVKLLKLGPRHKEVLALVAQGLGRQDIGAIVGFEPEYISWIVRQDVCREYLAEMTAVVDYRLAAMTGDSVAAIADVLSQGNADERLKAAKLQLEAVGRVGSGRSPATPTEGGGLDRLALLAERLIALQRPALSRADIVDVEPRAAA